MFPRDMVCLRNISVDTMHKGDNDDDDDDDDNNNNNNKSIVKIVNMSIPINQPTRCNNFLSLLLDLYVRLNMFRASSRPSSGAQQLQ